jgi:hypothetical protein
MRATILSVFGALALAACGETVVVNPASTPTAEKTVVVAPARTAEKTIVVAPPPETTTVERAYVLPPPGTVVVPQTTETTVHTTETRVCPAGAITC